MSTSRPSPPPTAADAADSRRFTALWDAHAGRVHAYAARHVGVEAAEEVVAETFLVAWRRLADVPGAALPWLLVVARNTIANNRRSTYRRRAVEAELARVAHLVRLGDDPGVPVGEREALLAALTRLTAREREALFLVGWDGLDLTDAARVAGCSAGTFRMRLSRARRRLTAAAGGTAADEEADRGRPVGAGAPPGAPPPRPSGRPAVTDTGPTTGDPSSDLPSGALS